LDHSSSRRLKWGLSCSGNSASEKYSTLSDSSVTPQLTGDDSAYELKHDLAAGGLPRQPGQPHHFCFDSGLLADLPYDGRPWRLDFFHSPSGGIPQVHVAPVAELFSVYIVMAVVLMFRPQGLFQRIQARKI